MSDQPREFAVVANVVEDSALRIGGKVWILREDGDAERPVVEGLNRQGRTITKRVPYKRLTNYRAAWVPEYRRGEFFSRWLMERSEAERVAADLAARWSDVRYFRPDGTLAKDGKPASAAFSPPVSDR